MLLHYYSWLLCALALVVCCSDVWFVSMCVACIMLFVCFLAVLDIGCVLFCCLDLLGVLGQICELYVYCSVLFSVYSYGDVACYQFCAPAGLVSELCFDFVVMNYSCVIFPVLFSSFFVFYFFTLSVFFILVVSFFLFIIRLPSCFTSFAYPLHFRLRASFRICNPVVPVHFSSACCLPY